MSADLFAEFNGPSNTAAPAQNQQQNPPPASQPSFSPVPVPSKAADDPFAFLSSPTSTQPAPQHNPSTWSTFQSQPAIQPAWNATPESSSFTAKGLQNDDGDEDGWGDFEVAQPSATGSAASKPPSLPAAKLESIRGFSDRPPRLVRASTLDIINNTLADVDPPANQVSHHVSSSVDPFSTKRPPQAKPRMKPAPSDPNVLFDVADFELQGDEEYDENSDVSDDEFGDFETVSSTKPQKRPPPPEETAHKPPPSMDLLSLDDQFPEPEAPKEATSRHSKMPSATLSFGATDSKPRKAQKTPSNLSKASPAVADDGDEWGAWDDFSSKGRSDPEPAAVSQQAGSWDWDAADTKVTVSETSVDEPPPVNVPPPSVLLSAFPALLGSASDFFKSMSGPNASLKQRVLSDPKSAEFLQGYILLATTAAHIMAGRKQRWHRDKILAKSMSISAAGSKGMKLAGIDKTQAAREDREAADVVAAWREHVGRLRSAVAAANTSSSLALKVPEISEVMPVQSAKLVPTAPKACVICGLKREERVAKVDHEVEDSFGEWWVDHWGHRACKNFWIEHETALRQR
jgi:hypothetical protein